jgi:type I restriction enzyme R subunit
MRRLIDTYIAASAPQAISELDNLSLMQLIAKIGIDKAIKTRIAPLTSNKNAIADTMAQNARATITLKSRENPQYYRRMSEMLDEVIQLLRTQAIDYVEYLRRMATLAKQIVHPVDTIAYPIKALYDIFAHRRNSLSAHSGESGALQRRWRYQTSGGTAHRS